MRKAGSIRTKAPRRLLAVLGTATLALGVGMAPALADNVQNDINVSVAGQDYALVAAGSPGGVQVGYWIQATGPQNLCDAADGSGVTITPQAPAGVTFSPTSTTFTSCGEANAQSFTVTATNPGVYPDIEVLTADSMGTYNPSPAKFTLYAYDLRSFESGCLSPLDSVAVGTAVCAKAASLPSTFRGKLDWVNASAVVANTTSFTSGLEANTASGTYTPTTCGTWTMNLYNDASTPALLDSDTFEVTGCAAANTAPSASFTSPPTTANEGSATTFNFSITDPDAGNTFSFATGYPDCGSGTATLASIDSAAKTGTFTCTWRDGPSSETVKLKVADSAGAIGAEVTTAATVNNVAPTATLDNAGPVNEGSAVAVTFSNQTDPSSTDTTAGFRYAFSCTNGSLSGFSYSTASSTPSTSCTFQDNGSYPVAGRIFDKDDGYTDYTTAVTVNNVAPSISQAAFGSNAFCSVGGATNTALTVTFSDQGTLDTHKAKVDWDNDGVFEETIPSYTSGTAIPHLYSTAGSHTAAVKVVDDDDGESTVVTSTVWVAYNMSNILQPINDTRNGQAASLFKYGSTIPVKVEVTDCDGSHPSGLTLQVTWAQGAANTPVGVEEVVPTSQPDVGNTMRFSDPLYVLQLNSKKTTADSTSGIRIWVSIMDGTTSVQSKDAFIGFKK